MGRHYIYNVLKDSSCIADAMTQCSGAEPQVCGIVLAAGLKQLLAANIKTLSLSKQVCLT